MNTLAICVLLVGMTTVMTQDPWPIGMYPSPRKHPERCGRPSPSFVCDPDGILTRDQADQLDGLITHIRNHTNCPCSRYQCDRDSRGYQVGISLVMKMDIKEEDDEVEAVSSNLNAAKLFSYTQLIRWKDMGQCDENVMLFYSVKDNVLYTMTGETARKKLNNQQIGYISLNRRREFGFSDHDAIFKALKNMLEDFRAVFTDNYDLPSYADKNRPRTGAVRGGRPNNASSVVASTALCLLALLTGLKMA